jgi:uncharacterized protein YqgC (DUF456 family)
METVVLAVICSVLMLAGLLGVILPFLPGLPLAWLGFFIYAIGTGWERIPVITIIVFSVLTVLLLILDLIAPVLGAKKYRASKWGVLGTFIGLMAGIIIFNVWGIILGPLAGALAGELLAGKPAGQAFKSAMGAFTGFIFGSLLKIVFILVMAGFFIVSLF